MTLIAHKDGQMRLYSGTTGGRYYLELLFTDASFNAPTMRKKTEERFILDRGVMDFHAHYVQGGDDPIMEPLPLTVSLKVNDTTSGVSYLDEWFRGGLVNLRTIVSTKGYSQNDGTNTNPSFVDSTKKCFNVECIWDTTGTDLGYRWAEVYFTPDERTITEGEDGVTINLNGQIYGTIARIGTFTTATDVTG